MVPCAPCCSFTAIGIPIVATYTLFVFWTFRGKVKLDERANL